MKASAFALSAEQRSCVNRSLAEVCVHRGWDLIAANVRTNHVHVIVATSATPERVMNDLKARATRRLREEGLVLANAVIWSRHGSTRYLWTETNVEDAYRYVVEGQGADLEG
jgi:REP element-mobilizing transposase RayT